MQPNSSDVQVALGEVRRQGRWSEALAVTRRSEETRSRAASTRGARLFVLLQEARRYAEAEALAREQRGGAAR